MQSYTVQQRNLDTQVSDLRGKLASLESVSDTFDREFQDRAETGQIAGAGRLSRFGLNTIQDWALFSFFGTYILMVLGLFFYALAYSTKKLFAMGVILGVGFLFSLLLAAILLRFG